MKNHVKISSVGIHSGELSTLVVRPMKSGGIVFIRNGVRVPALYNGASGIGLRSTTIGCAPNHVQTVEHLMCALFVCGIKNAEIDIDNVEMPVLDGSAAEFIKLLSSMQIKDQRIFLRVRRPVFVRASEIGLPLWQRVYNFLHGIRRDGYVALFPAYGRRLEIEARLVYKNLRIIGDQSAGLVFDYDNFANSAKAFVSNFAKARTFGTVKEWEWLKKHGMGKGANEHNVIGLGTIEDFDKLQALGIGSSANRKNIYPFDGITSLTGLYWPDEFVRHKVVDAVGDLYTSGFSIIGRFESCKGSHAMNNLLLRKLFSNTMNYDIINM
jgi:UDP-3-O-[3-hydroxymyristoyl] N-acetylglucosamine deacetylase